MLVPLPLMLDQPFRSTDVRNRVRWPHNGLACGGEGLGPKQGKFFGESKSACGSDCGEDSIQGVISLMGAVQDSRW